jgi:hypothetical protein
VEIETNSEYFEDLINQILYKATGYEKFKVFDYEASSGKTLTYSKAVVDYYHQAVDFIDTEERFEFGHKSLIVIKTMNLDLSGLKDRKVRFITDDAVKFTQREKKRKNFYDAIIMDPPSYGRGPNGELWNLEDNLYSLIELCREVLVEKPLFFLINTYATSISPTAIKNILNILIKDKFGGKTSAEEIGLPISSSHLVLPCGAFGRWEM